MPTSSATTREQPGAQLMSGVLRWSEDELKRYQSRQQDARAQADAIRAEQARIRPARVESSAWERMNKTETRFARLIGSQLFPMCLRWRYEGTRFTLADGLWYTPDFEIVLPDRICYCEIKGGYIRQAGWDKFKIARSQLWWFEWQLWQYKGHEWTRKS